MDINDLRTGVTVLMFALFIGIVWWAYSDRRKAAFDDAARIALDDDLPLQLTPDSGTGKGNFHE